MIGLGDIDPAVSRPLLVATVGVLALATLALGNLSWNPWFVDVVVVALAMGLAAAWNQARRYTVPLPAPAHERLRAVRLAAHPPTRGPDHGVAWNDRLAALDPSFSVPVLHRALRLLAGDGAWGSPIVESARFPEGEVVLTALLPGRPESVRLVVCRPLGVPLSRPGSVEHGWKLAIREPVPGVPIPEPPPVDPGLAAARRALMSRDPSFDVDDFASYLRELRAEVGGGDVADHVDPQGQLHLAFYGTPGPAADGAAIRWLEVELDGWFERIEVVHDGWWTSLLRPAGQADAAWKVWRWVPVAEVTP
jgi:hypothetical protein